MESGICIIVERRIIQLRKEKFLQVAPNCAALNSSGVVVILETN